MVLIKVTILLFNRKLLCITSFVKETKRSINQHSSVYRSKIKNKIKIKNKSRRGNHIVYDTLSLIRLAFIAAKYGSGDRTYDADS
jgi:hypothetical protein